ncbi:MAG: 1-acyl-sn-glycerol-3-phosphate acyltransferase [Desulfobacterales bacterium]|nr:1-acyl-sn-glycerol-3-phosphate acyltransferase [Desulfobacterales bacterium]MDJ0874107.1 1-acyl-sn-glycerol-3-phosphate acyltransferase [Desulfobacterales bacterium]MDJ0883077.1 1-acyl-sn-glycerol-3-phosphate acyltransferase [Desulfobacterales bacterium]
MTRQSTPPGLINRLLQQTHDHFSWFLPARLGRLPAILLRLLFSHVTIEKDQTEILRRLPQDAVVVYVTKHKSRLERLFFHAFYHRAGLPCPEIGFFYRSYCFQPLIRLGRIFLAHLDLLLRRFRRPDPFDGGYLARELRNGRCAMLSLVESNEFYRRYVQSKTDPLAFLIALQDQIERPIWLVPQLIFYTTGPVMTHKAPFMGSDPNPGLLRRLWKMIFAPEKILVEISEPVSIRAFRADLAARDEGQGQAALVLRHQLLDRITRHRQSITGPILKPAEEIRQHILTNDRLQQFMQSYARRRKKSIPQVHREALKYVDEIAARPNPWVVQVGLGLVHGLLNAMFDGLSFNSEGFNAARRASREGPLVLIPCHKSHIDYLVLSYLMGRNNMPCPHIFAGSNLAFWPVGPFFRRVGAFFVRRSFSGAVFYAKVFSEYIRMLLGQGFNIEVFIEGTRSRNGKLLLPKLGMLSIILNAVHQGACEHLTFVPIYVGYDRVPEEGAYIHEVEGGQKAPESFGQFFRARRLLKKRFGRIYIKFCEPLRLRDLENAYGVRVRDMRSKELRSLTRDLGNRVLQAIDRETVVTPQAIVAAALLNRPHKIISQDQVDAYVDTFMTYLDARQVTRAETLAYDVGNAVDRILKHFVQQKYIKPFRTQDRAGGNARHYQVNPAKRSALDYYKNNCIAPFVPAALTAISILAADAFQFTSRDLRARFEFQQHLFQNEFSLGDDAVPDAIARKTLKAFMEDAIVVPHPSLPEAYNLTSEGYRKLKCFAGFLSPLFESYRVVLRYFQKTAADKHEAPQRLKQIQSLGAKMYKRQEVVYKEALSKINYLNAVDYCLKNGIRGREDSDPLEAHLEGIRKCMKHLPL